MYKLFYKDEVLTLDAIIKNFTHLFNQDAMNFLLQLGRNVKEGFIGMIGIIDSGDINLLRLLNTIS